MSQFDLSQFIKDYDYTNLQDTEDSIFTLSQREPQQILKRPENLSKELIAVLNETNETNGTNETKEIK